MLMIKDLENICPFWDICATTQFHMRDKMTFIMSVCRGYSSRLGMPQVDPWEDCTHYMSLVVQTKESIRDTRKRMRDKYGKAKYDLR